jgi:hypothetical protein
MPITTKLKAVSLGVNLALAGLLVGCNQNDADPQVKDNAYYRGQAEAMVARLTLSEELDLLSGPGYGSVTPSYSFISPRTSSQSATTSKTCAMCNTPAP